MKPITITDVTFEQEVLKSNTLTIVDFWAEWCGPCKMIAPILEDIAGKYADSVKVTKLDVDENQNTAVKFGVRSIPTLLFFKDGRLVNRIIGYVPKEELTKQVDQSLAQAA